MVRPCVFGYYPETAVSNSFQVIPGIDSKQLNRAALHEFDEAVKHLRDAGVSVLVSQSQDELAPDAVFPNNWISTHEGGRIILYPMQSPSRRRERDPQMISSMSDHFIVNDIIDMSWYEREGLYLEGTGSLVFDHLNRKVYAALSPRTNAFLVTELVSLLEYEPLVFNAFDGSRQAVYHTNVVMNIGNAYAVVCLDALYTDRERNMISSHLRQSGREVIPISMEQMNSFCGNMLEVSNADDDLITICSSTSFNAFDDKQLNILQSLTRLLVVDIPVIEQAGGGSIRCMLTEIYLEDKK
jgi:hypothetical protein